MSNPINFAKQYEGARVSILGASGFIGRWVARYLSTVVADLYLIVRDKTNAEKIFSNYEIQGNVIELDLLDFSATEITLKELKPTITFNLTGYGIDKSEKDEEIIYHINADLVQTIFKGIKDSQDGDWNGQAIVHVGSALEYGEVGGNLSEDTTPAPTTIYGKSKLAGTNFLKEACQTYDISGLTARLFTVYGPGEHQGRLLPSLIEASTMDDPLDLTNGEQKRDFTYVADIAEGLLRLGLVKAEPGEIVNLATGTLSSVRSFIKIAAEILEIPVELLNFGAIPANRWEMVHDPVSIERLEKLTCWSPPTEISEGIRKTLAFNLNYKEWG